MSNTTPASPHPAKAVAYGVALAAAWTASVFSAVIIAMLLMAFMSRSSAADPAEDVEYQAMKQQLRENPNDEALAEKLREYDKSLNTSYFRQRDFAKRGALLAVGGFLVMIGGFTIANELKRRMATPEATCCKHDTREVMASGARIGVFVVAALLAGLAAGVSLSTYSELALLESAVVPELGVEEENGGAQDNAPTTSNGEEAVEPALPTQEEIEKYWASFRGPGGSGVSRYDNIPTKFDGTTGEGILWKTPVPLTGFNSPIVWENRVFLSGADVEKREVYCFDADTGEIVWTTDVPFTPQSQGVDPEPQEDTGYAAPTLATDGIRVYAMFGTGDVAAIDFEGELKWIRGFGVPDNTYGHSSSPVVFEDMVIVQFDQAGRRDGLSKLMALDSATGETRWETPRESDNSWASPIVATIAGKPQIVSAGCPYVFGNDPYTGEELWRAEATDGDMGPSPVASGDMVYTSTYYYQTTAIDATGSGDVTESHIKWIGDYGAPETASPLVTDKHLYLVDNGGYFTCYDLAKGEMAWELEIEIFDPYSSPALAGDLVYIFGREEGMVHLIKPGETEGEIVATLQLGEPSVTSPALQDGRIYIRGQENLICIGE